VAAFCISMLALLLALFTILRLLAGRFEAHPLAT
jgi:hypothetical protein